MDQYRGTTYGPSMQEMIDADPLHRLDRVKRVG